MKKERNEERNKEKKKQRKNKEREKERKKELPLRCLQFRLFELSVILFLVSLLTFEQSCAFSNELAH